VVEHGGAMEEERPEGRGLRVARVPMKLAVAAIHRICDGSGAVPDSVGHPVNVVCGAPIMPVHRRIKLIVPAPMNGRAPVLRRERLGSILNFYYRERRDFVRSISSIIRVGLNPFLA
jgi:hypothetical protein